MQLPDFDRIATLRTRLNHSRQSDRCLGYEIIAALLPGTPEALKARECLGRDDGDASARATELDITTSIDTALQFLADRGLGENWDLFRRTTRAGDMPDPRGLYGASMAHGIFSYSGAGWTAPNAVVDLAIQAICSGAEDYSEEEVVLLSATPDLATTAPVTAWSNDLKDQTRKAIADFWPHIEMWGKLRLKNCDGRFGTIEGYELDREVIRVVDTKANTFSDFSNADALIEAGWALD